MAIKTYSSEEYKQALLLLLPPGEYWKSDTTHQLMAAKSKSLSTFELFAVEKLQIADQNSRGNSLKEFKELAEELTGNNNPTEVSDSNYSPLAVGFLVGDRCYDNNWLRTITIENGSDQLIAAINTRKQAHLTVNPI